MTVPEVLQGLVQEIENLKQLDDALQKNEIVVLDFYSTACPPCKVVSPLYSNLAKDYPKAKFFQINGLLEEGALVQQSINVIWWPTFVIFKNQKETWRAEIPNPPQKYPTAELEAELKKVYFQ